MNGALLSSFTGQMGPSFVLIANGRSPAIPCWLTADEQQACPRGRDEAKFRSWPDYGICTHDLNCKSSVEEKAASRSCDQVGLGVTKL